MELTVICALLFISITLLAYQLSAPCVVGEVHLPAEIKGRSKGGTEFDSLKDSLHTSALFFDRLVQKANIPLENLKRKLVSAGKPMNIGQFFAAKFLLAGLVPSVAYMLSYVTLQFKLQASWLILFLAAGFIMPDAWLRGRIKKRHTEHLRNLPHVIDLLNICVGAGLDFMVAVNRVISEFRPCALIDEFKAMMQEMQMGSSRRDALKSLADRINSPEVYSFVRTLLQADRMGTSIGDALRMQAEEIRIRRFQKGEEQALKAPIKLLFPLLFFILPVVLIIVAGPILIQFTRGGTGIKF